jgi:hypothetical protein
MTAKLEKCLLFGINFANSENECGKFIGFATSF